MSIFKMNLIMLGKYILCIFLSFIVVLSFTSLFAKSATDIIGYTVYSVDGTENATKLYTHMLEDGEDLKAKEYEDKGFELEKINIYSEFKGPSYIAMLILIQICTLGILVVTIYSKVYNIGDSDLNKVNFGRISKDALKGFKIAIAPALLSFISYILLVLGKCGILSDGMLAVFKLVNYPLYTYNEVVLGRGHTLADVSWLSVIAAFLPVIIVPLLCQISYAMGYKQINITEKIVFKDKKGDK